MTAQQTGSSSATGSLTRPDWEIVGLLWVAFFLNQADRQVFNVVIPLLRNDLGMSETELGLVASTFTIVYGILVPVAGFLGDFTDRRRLVITSLIIFSVGTLLTGFATSLVTLILFRGLATGAGEALYAPAASSLIGESHVHTRARALAIHQTANYTGIVAGSLLAGWIGQTYGWRMAFVSNGILGLVWAVVMIARKPARAILQRLPVTDLQEKKKVTRAAVRMILSKPIVLAQMLAFGGLVFSYVGFLTWMPTLLYDKFAVSLVSAGFSAVFYHLALSYLALLVTSVVTDRYIRRFPSIRLLAMSVGLMVSGPIIAVIPALPTLILTYVALAAYGFARGMYDTGIFAAIFDEIPDAYRSTTVGLVLSSGFVIGAASPVILGVLKQSFGFQAGFFTLAAASFLTGIVLLATTAMTDRSPTKEVRI